MMTDPIINEFEERQLIVEEAKSWLRTPFHHEARIKGAGVDCGTLIAEVFERTGLIPHVKIPHYSRDFMLHRDQEWYLQLVMEYFNEIAAPLLPADIILVKNGRLYSHGMIIVNHPLVVHASSLDKMVIYADISLSPLSCKMRYFRLKRWCNE